MTTNNNNFDLLLRTILGIHPYYEWDTLPTTTGIRSLLRMGYTPYNTIGIRSLQRLGYIPYDTDTERSIVSISSLYDYMD